MGGLVGTPVVHNCPPFDVLRMCEVNKHEQRGESCMSLYFSRH